jgi:hypothetical protein
VRSDFSGSSDYTGNLDVAVTDQIGSTKFEDILEKVRVAGTLKLVAVTKINFDGDGKVLVPPQAMPDHVRDAHDAAVVAGLEVRAGLLELFSEMTGLVISKV